MILIKSDCILLHQDGGWQGRAGKGRGKEKGKRKRSKGEGRKKGGGERGFTVSCDTHTVAGGVRLSEFGEGRGK